jgi:hypothetical protein
MRPVSIVIAAAALALACLRERGGSGGTVWADPGAPASLAAGLALLAFWTAAALRAGRAAALRVNPRAQGAAAALWTLLYAYTAVLLMVLCAAAAGQINAIALTVLSAALFIAFGDGRRAERPPPAGHCADHGAAGSGAGGPALARLFREHPLACVIVGAIGLLAAVNAVWAFMLPPFAHDDFTYHLVFPVEWAQSGSLGMRAVPFGNHSPPYYPMNTEMFYLWLFLPLREAFHLNAAQAVFLVMAVLALHEIFRRCGASARASLLAAALFCLSPVAAAEAGKAYVDVAFAAFFLTALNAALAFRSRPSRLKFLQFVLCVGIFAGTKIPGVVFSAVILIPFFAVVLVQCARQESGRAARVRFGPAAALLAAAAAIFFAAGGWWYVRNLIVAGNPVFPLDVGFFGATIFHGAYGREALPVSHAATLLELHTPALLALIAAGLLVTAVVAARPRRGGQGARPGAALLAGLLLPALMAALYHFLLPFDYARFVLALCGLAGAALLVPLDLGRAVRRAAEAAIAAALVASLIVAAWREKLLLPLIEARLEISALVLGGLALGLLGAAALGWAVFARPRSLVRIVAGACSAGLIFLFFWAASTTADPGGEHFVDNFRKSREHYMHLHANYSGATVAVAGTNRSFLLYGRDFTNRVVYVNVNRSRGWMLHDFVRAFRGDRAALRGDRNAVALYRCDARYPAWAANLEAADVDLLFVERLTPYNLQKEYARDQQGFPLESMWAERHPEKFRRVYGSPIVRIYEVLR